MCLISRVQTPEAAAGMGRNARPVEQTGQHPEPPGGQARDATAAAWQGRVATAAEVTGQDARKATGRIPAVAEDLSAAERLIGAREPTEKG